MVRQDLDSAYRAIDGTFGSLHRIATSVRRYFRYRRDYKHLQQLPDRLLEDIGLTRADVHRAMRSLKF
jgi:uncharacterized protein YjiS (DUF1127 family)